MPHRRPGRRNFPSSRTKKPSVGVRACILRGPLEKRYSSWDHGREGKDWKGHLETQGHVADSCSTCCWPKLLSPSLPCYQVQKKVEGVGGRGGGGRLQNAGMHTAMNTCSVICESCKLQGKAPGRPTGCGPQVLNDWDTGSRNSCGSVPMTSHRSCAADMEWNWL